MKQNLSTLIVDPEDTQPGALEHILSDFCPDIAIQARVNDVHSAQSLIRSDELKLVIINIQEVNPAIFSFLNLIGRHDLELIIIARLRDIAFEVIGFRPSGFVLKPLDAKELIGAIHKARERVFLKEELAYTKKLLRDTNKKLVEDEMLGIPTLEGYDFIKVREIIRCKGLVRCTQIVTTGRSNIVSSYNIGEFIRMLEPFGLFTPHKSHLINLSYMKKYLREGTIEMADNARIPVSRRRRADFLSLINHI